MEIETIGPPDSHHLSAAIGWTELGNHTEAKLELGKVASGLLEHPDVLEVRWAVHASEKNWAEALQASEKLVRLNPERASGWLHRAYALRRLPGGGLEAAWEALLPAAERFPDESTIPYNLSCYACQMGQLDDARQWLRRALKVGEKARIKAMALADLDLAPLWKEVRAY